MGKTCLSVYSENCLHSSATHEDIEEEWLYDKKIKFSLTIKDETQKDFLLHK
jgi:hypothetical protein